MKFSKLSRDVHRWGSILIALPVAVIIVSGVILQLKKDVAWIQPPSQEGTGGLDISFDRILSIANTVSEAEIHSWDAIDRLDVRPGNGIVKVRGKNGWEIQIDTSTGEVLQVAHRRSDLIESIHDGSFFHPSVKLWLFLPAALVLGILWGTGVYLFFLPSLAKSKNRRRRKVHVSNQDTPPKSAVA
jgi:uncharacterized iron-regulated membrane protein